jgi:hypothetical protein
MGTAKRISDYANKATLSGSEKLELDDAGVPYHALSQAIANRFRGTAGAAIASAATTDIGAATGVYVHVTGTTTITSLGSTTPGQWRIVVFDGALLLTHHAANLVLPGSASITTVAGDSAIFESEGDGAGGAGSRWKCVAYTRSDGTPVKPGAMTGQSKSADYTFVLADANTAVLHPSADVTGRTFTLPANASVAFPVFTMITVINQNGAGNLTLAITTDTLRWSPAGTAGSRTLAANGIATFLKITANEWLVSGTGLS